MNLLGVVIAFSVASPGHSVDMDILAALESSNNPRAVSKAGARGLYQIMPATWREFAEPGERWYRADDNRDVAERYLKWIERTLKRWGDPNWNSTSHILAAYNGGITRFKKRRFTISRMPRQTRELVRRYWARRASKRNGRTRLATARKR